MSHPTFLLPTPLLAATHSTRIQSLSPCRPRRPRHSSPQPSVPYLSATPPNPENDTPNPAPSLSSLLAALAARLERSPTPSVSQQQPVNASYEEESPTVLSLLSALAPRANRITTSAAPSEPSPGDSDTSAEGRSKPSKNRVSSLLSSLRFQSRDVSVSEGVVPGAGGSGAGEATAERSKGATESSEDPDENGLAKANITDSSNWPLSALLAAVAARLERGDAAVMPPAVREEGREGPDVGAESCEGDAGAGNVTAELRETGREGGLASGVGEASNKVISSLLAAVTARLERSNASAEPPALVSGEEDAGEDNLTVEVEKDEGETNGATSGDNDASSWVLGPLIAALAARLERSDAAAEPLAVAGEGRGSAEAGAASEGTAPGAEDVGAEIVTAEGEDRAENSLAKDNTGDASNWVLSALLATVAARLERSDAAAKASGVIDEGRPNADASSKESGESRPASNASLAWLLSALSARLEATKKGSEPADHNGGDGWDEASNRDDVLGEEASPGEERCEAASPSLSSLISTLSARLEGVAPANLQELVKGWDGAAADLSQQAMVATMRALGVEPFDAAENPDEPRLPRRPFDPVLALVLAGYSFRAYLDPPRASYRETFASTVSGSELSGLPNQIVHTEFVYPDTSIISRRADGLFLLHVHEAGGLDGRFATAEVNGAVVLDVLTKRHCSVLRQRDPQGDRIQRLLHRETDQLVLNLFASRREYEEGRSPTHTASVSLAKIVRDGLESRANVDGEVCQLVFELVKQDEKNKDFFQFSLLPREMKLPFQTRVTDGPEQVHVAPMPSSSVSIQATFVPFCRQEQTSETDTVRALLDVRDTSEALTGTPDMSEELQVESVLAKELAPGRMPEPSDWTRLAGVVRSLVERVGEDMRIVRTSTVTENVPGALFIESLSTDTEVWFFHDEVNRDIIISFRGTEQVSWRDFFTDAQLFLQRWTPGEEIDLNVDVSNTVGLADLVPSILPSVESPIPADSCAVHYGFLRAYMSVQRAVQRGINMLSSDLSEGYSLHFTGHSLGGALAIIAAADFQARHLFGSHDISCISYGAPKVGNMHFATLYNKLVPNSFRVVNDADLVSRMPRSVPKSTPLGQYKHAGRTVLVNDYGEYWIEGQNDSALQDGMIVVADPFRERYKDLQDLIAFEQKLWTELLSGRSVQHHMEDSYFIAMQRVLKKFMKDQVV